MKENPMMKKTNSVLLVLVMALIGGVFLPTDTKAQRIDPKFQSVFIYGISRQVDWSDSNSNFRIAVVGKNSSLIKELKKLAGTKKIDNRSVKIEEIPAAAGALPQDIVFVSSKNLLGKVLSGKSKNTMVLTAFSNGLELGSHINFYLDGNKVAFDFNKTGLNSTNLTVNDGLLKLASKVK